MLVLGLVRLGMSSHSLGWGWHDCPGILWHGVGFYWGGGMWKVYCVLQ